MLTWDQRLQPHPEVVDTEIGADEIALLHLETKHYFSLNLTGVRIWRAMQEGLSLREIARRLQDEFDVDAKQAERSVLGLLDELARHGLVESGS